MHTPNVKAPNVTRQTVKESRGRVTTSPDVSGSLKKKIWVTGTWYLPCHSFYLSACLKHVMVTVICVYLFRKNVGRSALGGRTADGTWESSRQAEPGKRVWSLRTEGSTARPLQRQAARTCILSRSPLLQPRWWGGAFTLGAARSEAHFCTLVWGDLSFPWDGGDVLT